MSHPDDDQTRLLEQWRQERQRLVTMLEERMSPERRDGLRDDIAQCDTVISALAGTAKDPIGVVA